MSANIDKNIIAQLTAGFNDDLVSWQTLAVGLAAAISGAEPWTMPSAIAFDAKDRLRALGYQIGGLQVTAPGYDQEAEAERIRNRNREYARKSRAKRQPAGYLKPLEITVRPDGTVDYKLGRRKQWTSGRIRASVESLNNSRRRLAETGLRTHEIARDLWSSGGRVPNLPAFDQVLLHFLAQAAHAGLSIPETFLRRFHQASYRAACVEDLGRRWSAVEDKSIPTWTAAWTAAVAATDWSTFPRFDSFIDRWFAAMSTGAEAEVEVKMAEVVAPVSSDDTLAEKSANIEAFGNQVADAVYVADYSGEGTVYNHVNAAKSIVKFGGAHVPHRRLKAYLTAYHRGLVQGHCRATGENVEETIYEEAALDKLCGYRDQNPEEFVKYVDSWARAIHYAWLHDTEARYGRARLSFLVKSWESGAWKVQVNQEQHRRTKRSGRRR